MTLERICQYLHFKSALPMDVYVLPLEACDTIEDSNESAF
jgi:hypothetical protein